MVFERILGFFLGSLVALSVISFKARAEEHRAWGDLGYAAVSAENEPESMELVSEDELSNEVTPDPVLDDPKPASMIAPSAVASSKSEPRHPSKKRNATELSTVKNTYGVVTEEQKPIQLYLSPFAGMNSSFGIASAAVSPKPALGVSLGALLSSRFLLEVNYLYTELGLSNPRINTVQGVYLSGNQDVFSFKQQQFGLGGKAFVLGRESRLRPFIGGGLIYSKGSLNYSTVYLTSLSGQAAYTSDMNITQTLGYGELGAEFAISKKVALSLGVKVQGTVSGSAAKNGDGGVIIDPSKEDVGNSLSRSAAYVAGLGLGVYF